MPIANHREGDTPRDSFQLSASLFIKRFNSPSHSYLMVADINQHSYSSSVFIFRIHFVSIFHNHFVFIFRILLSYSSFAFINMRERSEQPHGHISYSVSPYLHHAFITLHLVLVSCSIAMHTPPSSHSTTLRPPSPTQSPLSSISHTISFVLHLPHNLLCPPSPTQSPLSSISHTFYPYTLPCLHQVFTLCSSVGVTLAL